MMARRSGTARTAQTAAATARAAALAAALAVLPLLGDSALAQGAPGGTTEDQAPAGIPSITVHPDPNAQPGAPALVPVPPPEPAIGVTIDWQVKNRFRLFRDEKDFQRHVTAAAGRGVLATEQALAAETGGRGWARDTVVRLCIDAAGRVADECLRDGVRESYLAPADHRIEARLAGAVDPAAQCTWTFEDGDSLPRSVTAPCAEPANLRVVYGKPTMAVVDIATAGQPTRRATTEILVQDLLIAGLGDSIAAGEGNPDRPVVLSDEGFCFRRFGGGGRNEFFRPGRQGFKGDKACESGGGSAGSDNDRAEWARLSARWMSAPCHRSLYGYQLRAALALAVENPRIAVTFLPLACTGATIETGLFAGQPSRELNCGTSGSASCPRQMPGQIAQLRDLLVKAQKAHPQRGLDLVFLTVGANDVDFSGLVADVIIDASAERTLFRRAGVIGSIEGSQRAVDTTLPTGFQRLRGALKPLLGGSLDRLVYVSYGHPALSPQGGACPTGRDGFDVHPAFGVDGDRLARISQFVERGFFPRLKALATCTGVACADPSRDRMTFVDAHQPVFADHGFCARSPEDPPFDRDCFATDGTSFATSPVEGATAPLNCAARPADFRPYAPRARWIRTANDSYFAAMTFPEGVSPTMQPSDLHDATWGVLSAVYGGAVHPTAEGHAAMADAALPAARGVLGLPQPDPAITAAPLPDALPAPPPAGSLPIPAGPSTAGSGAVPRR